MLRAILKSKVRRCICDVKNPYIELERITAWERGSGFH